MEDLLLSVKRNGFSLAVDPHWCLVSGDLTIWRASWLGWKQSVPLLGAGELSMQPPAPALFVPLLMALWRGGDPSVWLS